MLNNSIIISNPLNNLNEYKNKQKNDIYRNNMSILDDS